MAITNETIRNVIDGEMIDLDPQELLDWIIAAPSSEEDYQAACDALAAAHALYAYCSGYHGGQWSDEYRILCELTRPGRYSPGVSGDTFAPGEDDEAATIFLALGGELDD